MTRKMTTEAGGLEIEDATYRVILESLEDTKGEWKGKPRELLKWTFRFPDVPGDDGEPGELAVLTSLALSPKSNLWAWYQALTGVTLDLDMEIDLEDMVGKEAQAAIVHKPGKDGTGSWPRIENLMALPKKGKAKGPPAPIDPYEGFRVQGDQKGTSDIDWAVFWAECGRKDVTIVDVAAFIGVAQVTPKGIRVWLEAGPDRTLGGLIADVAAVTEGGVDPDELPFE